MKIAPVTKPAWINSDDQEDYSFEWSEWTGDDGGDTECTLHFKLVDVEVDPINPDDWTTTVSALEVVGAEITLHDVTEYHDRTSLELITPKGVIAGIDQNNLECAEVV